MYVNDVRIAMNSFLVILMTILVLRLLKLKSKKTLKWILDNKKNTQNKTNLFDGMHTWWWSLQLDLKITLLMARQDKVLETNLTSPQMIVVQSLSRLLNCHSNHHPFSDHLDAVLYAIIMVFLLLLRKGYHAIWWPKSDCWMESLEAVFWIWSHLVNECRRILIFVLIIFINCQLISQSISCALINYSKYINYFQYSAASSQLP